ncbi:MAG: sigma-70 family RNA polymerase sigma factor, partial [Flavobacterium sp.]
SQLLLKNDEKAIQQLYKMYAPALMGIIKRIVTFDEIAEDLLQDSFVKIWKSIKMYDSSKGRLFTWMVNVARNLAIDHLRSKATSKSSKTEDIANIPSSLIDSQSQIIINTDAIGVKKLLNVLKSEQKLIVDMIYFQGYTQAQTSEILNMPLGTIKTKLRLAIQRLRQQFGGLALSI